MTKIPNPNKSLELVIKDSSLPELSKDYAELVIDGIMDEGVLKDIPLVGTVLGVMKFGNSVNKHLAAKKIYKFLFELHKIPVKKRVQKIDEINSSKKYQSSVGEMIFELLEKIESDGKPEIVGKLFAAVINEKIDYQIYLKCSHIIKNIFYYDLLELKTNYDGEKVYGWLNNDILNSGLITVQFPSSYIETRQHKFHDATPAELTDLGNVIINIGMK